MDPGIPFRRGRLRTEFQLARASTDPALYRTLREQITRFFVNGAGVISLARLEQLAGHGAVQVCFQPVT